MVASGLDAPILEVSSSLLDSVVSAHVGSGVQVDGDCNTDPNELPYQTCNVLLAADAPSVHPALLCVTDSKMQNAVHSQLPPEEGQPQLPYTSSYNIISTELSTDATAVPYETTLTQTPISTALPPQLPCEILGPLGMSEPDTVQCAPMLSGDSPNPSTPSHVCGAKETWPSASAQFYSHVQRLHTEALLSQSAPRMVNPKTHASLPLCMPPPPCGPVPADVHHYDLSSASLRSLSASAQMPAVTAVAAGLKKDGTILFLDPYSHEVVHDPSARVCLLHAPEQLVHAMLSAYVQMSAVQMSATPVYVLVPMHVVHDAMQVLPHAVTVKTYKKNAEIHRQTH